MKFYSFHELVAGEKKFAKALESLSDMWTVIHGMEFQELDQFGKSRPGEIDFILVHPLYGVVVVEVKGGKIANRDGQWYSTDKNGNEHLIKDPVRQANNGKFFLLRKLNRDLGQNLMRASNLTVTSLVSFPDGDLEGHYANWREEDFLTASSLNQLTLERALSARLQKLGARFSGNVEHVDKILNVLLPKLSMRNYLAEAAQEINNTLTKNTERIVKVNDMQIQALTQFSGRLAVRGHAGTGKTFIAIEQAATHVEKGYRVLFVCHTVGLKSMVEAALIKRGIRVNNFRTASEPGVLVSKFTDIPYDIRGMTVPQNIAKNQLRTLEDVESLDSDRQRLAFIPFDIVIADEAQDFSIASLKALPHLLVDQSESPMQIYFDPKQSRFGRDWRFPLEGFREQILVENCRNTNQISGFTSKLMREEVIASGQIGPKASVTIIEDDASMFGAAKDAIANLARIQKLDFSQVTVLKQNDLFPELRKLKDIFQGLKISDVDKFKGLENEGIVLCLGEYEDGDTSDWLRQLYVGSSRAKIALSIVVNAIPIRQSPTLQEMLRNGELRNTERSI